MIDEVPPASPDRQPVRAARHSPRPLPEEAARRFEALVQDAADDSGEVEVGLMAEAPPPHSPEPGEPRSGLIAQSVLASALDDSPESLDVTFSAATPRSAERIDSPAQKGEAQAPAPEPTRFAAILDRIAAPNAPSGETLLSMPDSRWLAQDAHIVQSVRGELSLSLRFNQNGHSEEELRALRRRLEARGLEVRHITSA